MTPTRAEVSEDFEERRASLRRAHRLLWSAFGLGGGLVFLVFPFFFGSVGGEASLFALLALGMIATAWLLWSGGCGALAHARGYSMGLGILLGSTIVGWLAILMLPDRTKPPRREPTAWPPPTDGFPPLQEPSQE